jgi:hypothetical protein
MMLDEIARDAGYKSWEDLITWQEGHDIYENAVIVPLAFLLVWWLFVLFFRMVRLPFQVAYSRLRRLATSAPQHPDKPS